jgi:DNA repair photolyase
MQLDGLRKTFHQIDKIRYRPALLQKIARGYFRTLILRRPTLRIVEFSINHSCQSGCEYCYATRSHDLARRNAARHDPTAASLLPLHQ